jgi:hypothetical protein
MPGMATSTQNTRLKKVLLVGGEKGVRVLDTLRKNLRGIGLTSYPKEGGRWKNLRWNPTKMPPDIDLVLSIGDYSIHPQIDQLVALAKANKVPYLRIRISQWPDTLQTLIDHGFVVPATRKDPIEVPGMELPVLGSLWAHQGTVYEAVPGPDPSKYTYFLSTRPGAQAVPPDDPRATRIVDVGDGQVGLLPGGKRAPARMPLDKWPGHWIPAWPPRMDSLWDFIPRGELLWPREPSFVSRVVGFNRGRVRLLDVSTGHVSSISKHEWPGDYVPHWSHENSKLRAALIGGRLDASLEELVRSAWDIDVEIFYMVPRDKMKKRWNFPDDVDIAILLSNDITPAMSRAALSRAAAEGVRIVTAPSGDQFQETLWEAMRDLFPTRYARPYHYGGLPAHQPAPDHIWIWTGEAWALSDRLTASGPPRPPPPMRRSADSPMALGLVLAALGAGLFGRS